MHGNKKTVIYSLKIFAYPSHQKPKFVEGATCNSCNSFSVINSFSLNNMMVLLFIDLLILYNIYKPHIKIVKELTHLNNSHLLFSWF